MLGHSYNSEGKQPIQLHISHSLVGCIYPFFITILVNKICGQLNADAIQVPFQCYIMHKLERAVPLVLCELVDLILFPGSAAVNKSLFQ